MAEGQDWVSVIRGLVDRMAASDVTELEVTHGDTRLRLRRNPESVSRKPDAIVGPTSGVEPASLHRVVAPLTGIYYATANPSSKPFVTAGDWVEQDTVVGLIEAMKVFNEITADCRGQVTETLVKQGQLVQAGETIVLVDTSMPERATEGHHE